MCIMTVLSWKLLFTCWSCSIACTFQSFQSAVGQDEATPDSLKETVLSTFEPLHKFHTGFLREVEQRLALWWGSFHSPSERSLSPVFRVLFCYDSSWEAGPVSSDDLRSCCHHGNTTTGFSCLRVSSVWFFLWCALSSMHRLCVRVTNSHTTGHADDMNSS